MKKGPTGITWPDALKKAKGNVKKAQKLYYRKVTTRKQAGGMTWPQALKRAKGNIKEAQALYYGKAKRKKKKRTTASSRTSKKKKRATARSRTSKKKPSRKTAKKRYKGLRRYKKGVKGYMKTKSGRKVRKAGKFTRYRPSTKAREEITRVCYSPKKFVPRKKWRCNPMATRKRRKSRRRARRRRSVRRRNPVSLRQIRSTLTSPRMYAKFGVGAAGVATSSILARVLSGQIARIAPQATVGVQGAVLNAVLQIASGVLIAGFLPRKHQEAFILGAGIGAVSPLVNAGVGAVAGGLGLSGYMTVPQMRSLQGYMTMPQARRLGMAGVPQLAY